MAPRPELALGAVLLTGCVFPSQDPSGIEFSWLFVESNALDGDDGRRVRTCEGAYVEDVNITVTDQDDAQRTRTFPHACEDGFQTVEEFQIDPSDVFISLRRGTYDVIVDAQSKGSAPLTQEEREVVVGSRGVTILALDVAIPVVDWTLDLAGTADCTELGLTLRYADPETALTDPPVADTDGEGDATPPLVYREDLTSDTGVSLGGTPAACGALPSGPHLFAEVDLGEYELVVDRDGVTCPVVVRIDRPDLVLSLDLANLPCAG